MFQAGSWLESLNIYVVENIVQSAAALGLVWLALALFKIREPALRIKFLLLPLALPLFTPILFYLLFPQRQSMRVLPLDKVLNLRAAFPDPALWETVSSFLTAALLVIAAFLLLKGAISIIALLWLPRRFPHIKRGENRQLDAILGAGGAEASKGRPRVLLSPSSEMLCCSFGLVKPYLLISQGLLQRLSDSQIEAVVAHEMGHIRRRDGWLGFALVTLRHILFFNPIVHLASRRLRLESEMAADELALGRGLDRSAYAQTLVAVCRFALWTSSLSSRLERLLRRGLGTEEAGGARPGAGLCFPVKLSALAACPHGGGASGRPLFPMLKNFCLKLLHSVASLLEKKEREQKRGEERWALD